MREVIELLSSDLSTPGNQFSPLSEENFIVANPENAALLLNQKRQGGLTQSESTDIPLYDFERLFAIKGLFQQIEIEKISLPNCKISSQGQTREHIETDKNRKR